MSQRVRLLAVALGGLLSASAVPLPLDADGKKIADFSLPDTQGKSVALADFKDRKAVVVVFLGTQCPVNNLYLPTLKILHEEFAPRGVAFLAVNANRQDSPEEIAAHARKNQVPFPVLRDKGNVVADRFGARRTPEAFVLDGQRRIRYQGRIDDQYGIDVQRPKATRADLAEALREVLAGTPVTVASTQVSGCFIGRANEARKDGPITYTKHVARILQNHCQVCHRPGAIGPMALLTYDDASSWADTIREVVQDRRMPPWHADPKFGKFSNDRSLPAADRDNLLAWIDQGCPKGDDRDLPPAKQFSEGWKIGKPDAVIEMPVTFEVPAQMPKLGVPYKHYVVPTDFPEDRWVIRAEAKPGVPEVVHHILVFVVPPGEIFFPGNMRTPVLCGTAPGDMPMLLPPGMAKHLPRGSKLVFQMHYTPNGKAYKDRSSIGLVFSKEPPKQVVLTVPVFNITFRIPPGVPDHKIEANYTLRKDGYIVGMMPHMHLRGKDFLYEAVLPDGKTEILLSVPRFNFNWQSIYRPDPPLRLPAGTRLHCVAHFDNSEGNPNNPDPTRTVFWGDQTWQEMMIGWTDIAYDRK